MFFFCFLYYYNLAIVKFVESCVHTFSALSAHFNGADRKNKNYEEKWLFCVYVIHFHHFEFFVRHKGEHKKSALCNYHVQRIYFAIQVANKENHSVYLVVVFIYHFLKVNLKTYKSQRDKCIFRIRNFLCVHPFSL